MGEPIKFDGCNLRLLPSDGAENVSPMYAFTNGKTVVACWRLTDAELQQVLQTGCVWVTIFGSGVSPLFVGSEDSVRDMAADYGVWKKP